MKLSQEKYDQLSVLAIEGDLNTEHVDRFRKSVLDQIGAQTRDFVLDLQAVDFVDSKGLETLIWLQDQVAEQLGQVRLACLPENIQTILEMTRLASRFDCHDDVDSAIKSLR